ncbi:ABC transporter ATP-binding protein [Lacticaseibacillus suibinensis]|uniref:ABC transporter ATP-binding protein n=1 Tax=Lacticaseibacillus suibinensis TaxID=2486011 RepID=UPI001944F4B9|nr:ABC transporter ATP-binding protein [Lacticaseibacillus suibinensis]
MNSIFSNTKWIYERIRQRAPKLRIWPVLNSIQLLVLVLLQSIIPSLVVWFLQNRITPVITGLCMTAICALVGALYWAQSVTQTWSYWENSVVRLSLMADDGDIFLSVPYQFVLDPDFKQQHLAAGEYGYGGDFSGVALFFPALADASAFLLSVLVATTILGQQSLLIPTVIVITVGIELILSRVFTDYREKIKANLFKLENQHKYFETSAYEIDLGQELRTYQLQAWYMEKLGLVQAKELRLRRRQRYSEALGDTLVGIVSAGRVCGIFYLLFLNFRTGSLTPAEFTFYFSIANIASGYLEQLSQSITQLRNASSDVSTGRVYLDGYSRYTTAQAESVKKVNETNAIGVRFDHVYFTYPHSSGSALQDINLTIQPGEKIAIVGPNGGGKSTLIMLLLGLFQPTAGQIVIDGQPIASGVPAYKTTGFSVSFQNDQLFADTVAYNVAVSDSASVVLVKKALEKVGLADVVQGLPQGLDSQMTRYLASDGLELSGGQTQSLLLARALYRDAPIQVLDEPTAALDALAEKNMYERYASAAENRTSIFISHRLASTQFVDRVVFLENGKILQTGSHDQLMASCPEYASMYHQQEAMYREGEPNEKSEG